MHRGRNVTTGIWVIKDEITAELGRKGNPGREKKMSSVPPGMSIT